MENFDLAVDLVDAISYRLDNGAVGTMGATGSVGINQDQNQEFRYYGTKGQLRQDMIPRQGRRLPSTTAPRKSSQTWPRTRYTLSDVPRGSWADLTGRTGHEPRAGEGRRTHGRTAGGRIPVGGIGHGCKGRRSADGRRVDGEGSVPSEGPQGPHRGVQGEAPRGLARDAGRPAAPRDGATTRSSWTTTGSCSDTSRPRRA